MQLPCATQGFVLSHRSWRAERMNKSVGWTGDSWGNAAGLCCRHVEARSVLWDARRVGQTKALASAAVRMIREALQVAAAPLMVRFIS